ncbi:hypothetical protein GE061_000991 [Apolygus lucorum]|uniref:Sodium/solute symporter n=1 Tax=Apolygus lucorum TaxID=248454 RepID=A0A8S9YBC4_APOLU|nr:hypothetical protein GE061_000991 [Apolygus lucorum]
MEGMSSPWIEYAVVALSLIITLGVGLYFSRDGKTSLQEYMLGSRRMTALPISLSIGATFLTGSSLVAASQEVYLYGMEVGLAPLIYATYGVASAWIYLPVSYSIKSASSFQFFDRRFNSRIRKFASIIYALETIHHTAMSIFIPAVSLSQVTGIRTFPIACVLALICLAYTASGGLKAVAKADSVQAVIFFTCAIVIIVVGICKAGGPREIWNKVEEGSRLNLFNFDTSTSTRYTFWNMIIGSIVLSTNLHLSPAYHQRVASMPTFKQAKQVVIWSSLFTGLFLSFTYLTGLVVYAYFAGCDPVLAKKNIRGYATILPYFVSQISQNVPGIEGIFLAGVIAAGLSTTTSCWNTVACTIYEDLVRPFLRSEPSKKTSFRILIGIVIIAATISTSFILLIEAMSSILEATLSLKSLSTSIYFILYHGGMFLPWVNTKGIIAGCLASGGMTYYIVIGNQNAKRNKLIKDLPKILTTANCLINGTTTMHSMNMTTTVGTEGSSLVTKVDPKVSSLLSLSMMLYMIPGAVLGLVVAYLVSLMTGLQDLNTVDREMIAPQMRWVLPKIKNDTRQSYLEGDEKEPTEDLPLKVSNEMT